MFKKLILSLVLTLSLIIPAHAVVYVGMDELVEGSASVADTWYMIGYTGATGYRWTIASLFGLKFGTMTDAKYCTYASSTGLISCTSDGASVPGTFVPPAAPPTTPNILVVETDGSSGYKTVTDNCTFIYDGTSATITCANAASLWSKLQATAITSSPPTHGHYSCFSVVGSVWTLVDCGEPMTYTEPETNKPICRTGSKATGECANLTDVPVVAQSTVPWQKDIHIPAPADTDVVRFRTTKTITLSSIGCIVDPADSGESVVVDIQECDGNGDTCTTILGATLTCGNTNTTATITDTTFANNVWILVDLGTVTGTVSDLSIYFRGTEAQ